jgi:hypothetical protein
MPRQISKSLSVLLLNEEVEVWNELEGYALRRRMPVISQAGTGKASVQRMLRVILRLAAERVADDIGANVAEKLALPRALSPRGRPMITPRPKKPKPKVRAVRAAKRPPVKPKHRIYWDRPWKEPSGGQ